MRANLHEVCYSEWEKACYLYAVNTVREISYKSSNLEENVGEFVVAVMFQKQLTEAGT